MNLWSKSVAYGVAFLSAAGTATKVTYDLAVPSVEGKLVKVKLQSSSGQEAFVWLPEELDYEFSEDSKLQLLLGENVDPELPNATCLSVNFKGDIKGGVILQGTLAAKSDLRGMSICKGQTTWTVVGKNGEAKKLRCAYGQGIGEVQKDGKKFLSCVSKPNNDERDEVVLGETKCIKEPFRNRFNCSSEKTFSLKYAPVNIKNGHADPAVEVAIIQ
ncbi:hypothetical protein MHLP_04135 [Candidatus Mycoplasma haematolamae str. Purdue]|uniref:Uncharacterized protein n=1 Tax=Mycoplasma haematolamae (strain Purdue) TaxID=1212765 RepID=I7C765_MYCHA|nr:hypothetical protein [Candidatus Mycoplasma haematolamae]AFO52407.1 hypothetical protein MHLP_04135 [Candidatus Mycoplasma haematolamae str. Purdue]